jgi:hypothetical protein
MHKKTFEKYVSMHKKGRQFEKNDALFFQPNSYQQSYPLCSFLLSSLTFFYLYLTICLIQNICSNM